MSTKFTKIIVTMIFFSKNPYKALICNNNNMSMWHIFKEINNYIYDKTTSLHKVGWLTEKYKSQNFNYVYYINQDSSHSIQLVK